MKAIIGSLILLVIVAAGIVYTQSLSGSGNPLSFLRQTPKASVQNRSFNLIVAKDPKDIEIGLSNRTSLPENEGMLFIFNKSDYYQFWMRDMKFPIDIIFIKDNKIVTIHHNAQPPKSANENIPLYKPTSPVNRVFEINAGLAKKYNIKEGDTVQFSNL